MYLAVVFVVVDGWARLLDGNKTKKQIGPDSRLLLENQTRGLVHWQTDRSWLDWAWLPGLMKGILDMKCSFKLLSIRC